MKIFKSKAKRSEDEWVSLIKKKFRPSKVILGIGDDCAIFKVKDKICITTDTLIEGIDFELSWAPPQAIGWKALSHNLSDLASTGARPHSFLLTLAIPKNVDDHFVEKLLDGIWALSKKEGITLIGGDLSASPDNFVISITAIGLLTGKSLLRSKAKEEDSIYVSSELGGPDSALKLFKKNIVLQDFPLNEKIKNSNRLLDRFFRPPSQTLLGIKLSEKEISCCAIDISDGLLKDLQRILTASKVGAIIDIQEIPRFVFDETKKAPLSSALTGGEEQTLLFTVSPEKEYLLTKHEIKAYKIGTIISEKALFIKSRGKLRKIETKGFDHFSKS